MDDTRARARARAAGWLRGTVAAAVVAAAAAAGMAPADAAPLTTQDMTAGTTAADLGAALVGNGVTVTNATYTGDTDGAGTFAGGTGVIGFEGGIILSSGDVANAIGPNDDSGASESNFTPGDADLSALSGQTTYDAAVLEFDFVPDGDQVFFQYVFASEEYEEYIDSYNDVFGFFVNGQNCATVGGQPVSINTVNDDDNPTAYVDNNDDDADATNAGLDTQADGLTVVLVCSAPVDAGVVNHMKLAVADGGDTALDAWVFLRAGSLTTDPVEVCGNGADDDGDGLVDGADPDCGTPNTPPSADAGGPYGGAEGAAVALDATVADPDAADTVTSTWSWAPGAGVDAGAACSFADASAADTSVTCTDDGSYTLTLSASDGGPAVTGTAVLTVTNATPTVAVSGPADMSLHAVGSTVSLSATFADAGANDTHTCSIDWGDGTVEAGTVGAGTCSGSHAYAGIGTPTVTVSVTDDDGATGSAELVLVVHDHATKVTGGGFVVGDGRTSFGFVAKQAPDGSLTGQLQVRAPGRHRFHGDRVVALASAANTASWSGTGRWDGAEGYTYEVSVVDNRSGGGRKGTADTIRIVVRDATGAVVLDVSGPLQGGNLTVHR